MSRRRWGILLASLAGFLTAVFAAETAWNGLSEKRCDYRFPWSGRCIRPLHHTGEHY